MDRTRLLTDRSVTVSFSLAEICGTDVPCSVVQGRGHGTASGRPRRPNAETVYIHCSEISSAEIIKIGNCEINIDILIIGQSVSWWG